MFFLSRTWKQISLVMCSILYLGTSGKKCRGIITKLYKMTELKLKKESIVVIEEVATLRHCGMECSLIGCDGFSFHALPEGGRCNLNFDECSGNVMAEYIAEDKYFDLF